MSSTHKYAPNFILSYVKKKGGEGWNWMFISFKSSERDQRLLCGRNNLFYSLDSVARAWKLPWKLPPRISGRLRRGPQPPVRSQYWAWLVGNQAAQAVGERTKLHLHKWQTSAWNHALSIPCHHHGCRSAELERLGTAGLHDNQPSYCLGWAEKKWLIQNLLMNFNEWQRFRSWKIQIQYPKVVTPFLYKNHCVIYDIRLFFSSYKQWNTENAN